MVSPSGARDFEAFRASQKMLREDCIIVWFAERDSLSSISFGHSLWFLFRVQRNRSQCIVEKRIDLGKVIGVFLSDIKSIRYGVTRRVICRVGCIQRWKIVRRQRAYLSVQST